MQNFLRSKRWKQLREQALRRDCGRCVLCGSVSKLNVHHVFPRKFFKSLQADIDNLVTCCCSCHFRIHKSVGNFELMLWLAANRPSQYRYALSHLRACGVSE